ncbi:MAG: helix-turn-helix domain-containing protein [Acidimicrobiales bacterium]
MRRTSFEDMQCSVAQALEVVGEWWSFLIIRDAFLGVNRFGQFQDRLGIARNVLSARLDALVEHGVLKRVAYQDNPVRHEYKLTEKGRDLWLSLTALREWGDRWAAPDGPPVEVVHQGCGRVTTVVPTCSSCGEVLDPFNVRAVAGPGMGQPPMVPVAGAGS